MHLPGFALVPLIVGLLCAGSVAADGLPNTLSEEEARQGWILLFDGKTLSGWEARATGSTDPLLPSRDWKVDNGAIVCGGTASSWLGTDASFSDYALKLEFRGSEKVNSGVFIRSKKDGAPHRTGYEVQIWDHQPTRFTTGSLMGSLKVESHDKILPDAWNSFEITADGERFLIALNGKMVLNGRDSKHSFGVVGFQCQRENPIEFRNIKLRPIVK